MNRDVEEHEEEGVVLFDSCGTKSRAEPLILGPPADGIVSVIIIRANARHCPKSHITPQFVL